MVVAAMRCTKKSYNGAVMTVPPEIFKANDIRGIAGETLTLDGAKLIGRALAAAAQQQGITRIALGRDGRLSSPQLAAALADGICQGGIATTDIGIVPTPALYYAAHKYCGGSGVMITGSHNPKNGIHFGRPIWRISKDNIFPTAKLPPTCLLPRWIGACRSKAVRFWQWEKPPICRMTNNQTPDSGDFAWRAFSPCELSARAHEQAENAPAPLRRSVYLYYLSRYLFSLYEAAFASMYAAANS